ncbi:MAG TPA: SLC13 family permease [Planctomycetota bacterium]|nr:SLC13 family permease [Planctomycetota bacterium]
MTFDQAAIFALLAASLCLFVLGTWRYDVVALLALLSATLLGIVPADRAFAGFGHPAVVTVAAVLVIGRALQNSGIVDVLSHRAAGLGRGTVAQVAALTGLTALASAFMNNVGALALMMPVAIRVARERKTPPSLVLMPLAFASLLGGLTTLIGTPPNIIVASFRERGGGEPFGLFDFTPVGGAVAVMGTLFLAFLGWRLVPRRPGVADQKEWFGIESYITELRVREGSPLIGQPLGALDGLLKAEVIVVGIVRGAKRLAAPSELEVLMEGDALIVEVDPGDLERVASAGGLELAGGKDLGREALRSGDVELVEVVVKPDSPIVGKSAKSLRLRRRHGVNLLAVAREGAPLRRLGDLTFRSSDVLLLQVAGGALADTLAALGCLPLAERGLRLGQPRKLLLGTSVFAAAVLATTLRLLPAHVAFTAAGLALVLLRLVSLRSAYDAIDWPVLILLGAMLPVGEALETTGGAGLVARGVLGLSRHFPPAAALAFVLVATMSLSDVVNNAAAAVVMAPIGLAVAEGLEVSRDPFLMAVAIGASCAFLTPIGHQSNTLVMGPGGYRFGDYWRVGLPLEALIVAVALPLLLLVWPL